MGDNSQEMTLIVFTTPAVSFCSVSFTVPIAPDQTTLNCAPAVRPVSEHVKASSALHL